MYLMLGDIYECDTCGVQIPWSKSDPKHGYAWGCEKCGEHFCERCFEESLGRQVFETMIREEDEVLCHRCYRKRLADKEADDE